MAVIVFAFYTLLLKYSLVCMRVSRVVVYLQGVQLYSRVVVYLQGVQLYSRVVVYLQGVQLYKKQ